MGEGNLCWSLQLTVAWQKLTAQFIFSSSFFCGHGFVCFPLIYSGRWISEPLGYLQLQKLKCHGWPRRRMKWQQNAWTIVRTCQRAGRDRRPAREGSKAAALPAPWCVQRWCRSECTRPPHGFPEGSHGGDHRGSAWWPAPRRGPWQRERPPQTPHG